MGNKTISRPISRRARKTGTSPYVRHGKVPYKYPWQSDRAAKAKQNKH